MAVNNSGCTVNASNGNTVDGNRLWGEVPMGPAQRSATDCDINQFAWNNFLYMASNSSQGHPNFMNLAPWNDAMPATGKPAWAGTYTPLQAGQMNKLMNLIQAGDSFQLLDVNGKVVAYDIRINEDFLNYISAHSLYTTDAIGQAQEAFNKNSSKGGIWLPPTSPTSTKSALEMKTAWRDYGSNANSCPASIMHCEEDSSGNWWGLIGMHLVQKTPQHGEMIWASFEHISNAPDCAKGGNNPIQKNPLNQSTLNTNQGISGVNAKTGWNLFNYAKYKSDGGDGDSCVYPQEGVSNPLCLTDPNPSGNKKTWISVNVCRADQLPVANNCNSATENLQITSCLNQNIQQNFPSGLDSKWKNYQLIGAEYVFWGSTGTGAPLVGCWNFDDGQSSLKCVADKSGEISVTRRGTLNLANTTMETWMQKNIRLKTASLDWTLTQQDCFSCHQPTTKSYQGDMSHIFGRAQQTKVSKPVKAKK